MPLLQGEGWSDNHDMIITFLLTILTKRFCSWSRFEFEGIYNSRMACSLGSIRNKTPSANYSSILRGEMF